MKNIKTLVQDIYSLFDPKTTVEAKDEHLDIFADNLKKKLKEKLAENKYKPSLRMSNLGQPCARKLWYEINKPELGEPLPPQTYLKFLFGDIIEELVLFLAKTAGHTVEKEQEPIEVNGVKGRCDAVVDGVLVDVKSASSRSFDKFEKGLTKDDDGFGYLTQLGLYNHGLGLGDKPAGFIAFDKQMATIALDLHDDLASVDYNTLVEERRRIVDNPSPPPRGFEPVPEGASGNKKLSVVCSYCPFKKTCYPGLRTFLYARGPVHLTTVVREPNNVPELK